MGGRSRYGRTVRVVRTGFRFMSMGCDEVSHSVDVEFLFSSVSGFWDEEEDQRQHDCSEDGYEVECLSRLLA